MLLVVLKNTNKKKKKERERKVAKLKLIKQFPNISRSYRFLDLFTFYQSIRKENILRLDFTYLMAKYRSTEIHMKV